jgi:hypothetical protein
MTPTFIVGRTPQPEPGLTIDRENQLVLTVEPDMLHVCESCPYLHVLILADATPAHLRLFAEALSRWADRLENVQ